MSKDTKQQEEKNKNTDKETDIIEDFKKEIFGRKRKNTPAILLAITLIVVVFGLLGVGVYQIFFNNTDTNSPKQAEEKIENRPEAKVEKKTEEQKTSTETPTQTTEPVNQTPTQPEYTEYTVQSGDTWSSIANENGMTSAKLMEYNGSTSEDLQIGQKIKIPKS